ncbi:DNA primase (plasmid) [Paraburkholderia kururiensis]
MYRLMGNRSRRNQNRAAARPPGSIAQSPSNAGVRPQNGREQADGGRLFLAVPYRDIGRARALGAEWDGELRLCWVPASADRTPFAAWLVDEAALRTAGINRGDVLADFADAMRSYGLLVPDQLHADGQWHCAQVMTRSGPRSHGGYIVELDGVPHGYIRNFVGASGPWWYRAGRLSREQRAALEAQGRQRQAEREETVRREQQQVAQRSLKILTMLPRAEQHSHPYLDRKGVGAYGLRIAHASKDDLAELLNARDPNVVKRSNATYLVIPGRDVDDRLLTAQAIGPDGIKMFVRDARKKGAFHPIGVRRTRDLAAAPAVLFAEGYATGASLHEATGLPVVVAFDAGNLVEVVRLVTPLLRPSQPRVVCGDNDQFFLDNALARIAETGGSPDAHPASVRVIAGVDGATREVQIRAAHADGRWHETARGKYRLSLESVTGVVRSVTLDLVVPDRPHVRVTSRNTGVEAAAEAARLAAGVAVTPIFLSLESRPTDFNDLDDAEGRARVRELVQRVLPFRLADDAGAHEPS